MSFNVLAILLAAVSSMVVGTAWFLPSVFGRRWQQITGKDAMKPRNPAAVYVLSFLSAVVTATVLSGAASAARGAVDLAPVILTLLTAAVLWLGFTAAQTAVHYLFEGRGTALYLINVLHQLVTVLVMAVIIGLFGFQA